MKTRIPKLIEVILFNRREIPIMPPSIIEFCTKNNSMATAANVAPIIKERYLRTNCRFVIGLCCFFMVTHLLYSNSKHLRTRKKTYEYTAFQRWIFLPVNGLLRRCFVSIIAFQKKDDLLW